MDFRKHDIVEICKKGLSGIYYKAVIVDAIGTNKYLVFRCFPIETDEVVRHSHRFKNYFWVDAFVFRAWLFATAAKGFDAPSGKDGCFLEIVNSDEVRPSHPRYTYFNNNFFESDRVDAFVQCAWRAGTVTRKFDSYYYVKLDCNGLEAHCQLHNVRPHFE